MHGGGISGRRAGDSDGERRARGFQHGRHGGGTSGRGAGDGDCEWPARRFQLGEPSGGASGRSAGGGDGQGRTGGIQLGQTRGSTSASASGRGAVDVDGEWRARRFQLGESSGGASGRSADGGDGEGRTGGLRLGQPRGGTSASASASAWTISGRNGAASGGRKPSPPRDVSERPGSLRHETAYLMNLMVARFIEMGFPAEKVTMAVEHAGRGGGDMEAAVLQWLFDHEEGSLRHGASHLTSPMVACFIEMGFSAEKVAMAVKHAGGGSNEEAAVLQWLLDHEETDLEGFSSSSDKEGFSSSSGDLEVFSSSTDPKLTESDKFLKLLEMGFTNDEASTAIAMCGGNEPLHVLADAVYAAQIDKVGSGSGDDVVDRQSKRRRYSSELLGHVERAFGSRLMAGFGVPNVEMDMKMSSRKIPGIAEGPPYFYFENVACAPRGVWAEMPRSLYNIEPEYVDSMYFCAASRKRGYIHNLPIAGRFPLLPMQFRTIKDAFPDTREWWPQWDTREHLNCIQTVMAPATASKMVRTVLTDCDGIPNKADQKKILDKCAQWSLIWVRPKTVAALEPDEVETLLGFPKGHTRSFTKTNRYKSLGNSFQIDTVAFHLSVLKAEFPHGIRVLSLFSGIGGAEVALHRLGIRLNIVVSAEISEVNQGVLRAWWDKSKQSGELIEIGDVEKVNENDLEALMNKFGGFDLIIGGSPCNNISGGNRHSRVGLKGEQSKLFYHYVRILQHVRKIMRRISP